MVNVSTLCYEAIANDDAAALSELLASHPEQISVHTFMAGATWLGHAAAFGKLACVQQLLAIGADPNTGDRIYGAKPICGACSGGHLAVAQSLIDAGSGIDTDVSVKNPLFASIIGRSVTCLSLILGTGIDAAARYNSETMTDLDAMGFALLRGERGCAEVIASWLSPNDEAGAAALLLHADRVASLNTEATR